MVKAAPFKKVKTALPELRHPDIFFTSHDESLAKRAFSLNIP
jgi:hypothetical protein